MPNVFVHRQYPSFGDSKATKNIQNKNRQQYRRKHFESRQVRAEKSGLETSFKVVICLSKVKIYFVFNQVKPAQIILPVSNVALKIVRFLYK